MNLATGGVSTDEVILANLKGLVFVGARRTWVDGAARLHLRFRDPADGREVTLTIEAGKAKTLGFDVAPSKSVRNRLVKAS